MAFIQGANSKVVIKRSGGSKMIQLPITSEALNPGGTLANSNAIFGSRVRGIGAKINPTADGSTDIELWMGIVPMIFYGALGSHTSSGNGTDSAIVHTITPSADGVPAFEIFVRHYTDTGYQYKITDAVMNSLRVSLATDAPWSGTIDWIGISWAADNTDLSSPDYDIESESVDILFSSHLTTFTMGSIDMTNYTTSLEFTIANNIEADRFKLDGSGRFAVLPGDLEITGTLTVIMPESSDSLGSTLKSLDIGSTLNKITVKYASVDEGQSAADEVQIDLQNIYVTGLAHDVNSRGAIEFRIDFMCVKDGSTEPIVVTATNGVIRTDERFVVDAA